MERRRGGSSSFLFCFCIASSLCFYTPASLFLLLFLMVVVVLLSMVAQGSSCGGNKEGRQWCPPFSFMFLPSFCFLPSPFLSFSFFVLFPFVSFLFLSSMSLFLSLLSSSILKQPSPCQLSPRSPPVFYLLCFLLSISSPLFQTVPSTLSLSLSLLFVLSLSLSLKKTLPCPLKNCPANHPPFLFSPLWYL